MNKREVIRTVLRHERPPYVPWSFGFTLEAKEKLRLHYGPEEDLETVLGNHLLRLGSDIGFFTDVGPNLVQDVFGVVWDRSIDKDIGNVKNAVLSKPTLKGYSFPDPVDPRFFADIPEKMARYGDRFRVYQIGFSLWERAWTMRGFQNLMMDFYDHPSFVRDLLHRICDYNSAQINKALDFEIDGVYFGDDWGQQRGLQMGPQLWREFIYPVLQRMYGEVKKADKVVMIHSCGDVDELFDDLIAIGLNCFNPFQPEVMDIHALMDRYHGRLAFHGGLSTQQTLPYGTAEEVRRESFASSSMERKAATSSHRRTTWRAMFLWTTCWRSSTPPNPSWPRSDDPPAASSSREPSTGSPFRLLAPTVPSCSRDP